jgi:hypothetical protein
MTCNHIGNKKYQHNFLEFIKQYKGYTEWVT